MKKRSIFTIVCAFSMLLFSCKENTKKTNVGSEGTKTISLSSIEDSLQDTIYFKPPQIVVLETNEESLLAEITRVYMDDDVLFVYDKPSEKIFMFDISGKYLNRIDCKGEGPREYVQITDFTVDTIKKEIILLCAIPKKRMYFTYNGVFVKEEKHSDYYSQIATDGDYIYFEKNVLTEDYQINILNEKTGKTQKELKSIDIKNYFYAHGNSLNRGINILYVRRYDNTIYELSNGKITETYHVDFQKHSFPDWLIKEEETTVISNECRSHEYVFSMTNVSDHENYLMFYSNIGVFLYDKRKDILTGYREMRHSLWDVIGDYPLPFYSPLENTNKIVYSFNDPSFIKQIADNISIRPENVNKLSNINPKFIEEILSIGGRMTEDNNPILFIYEFKSSD
ncbi:hypothetical protein M2137_002922 [Parabacteroides sp. PFB2-10]|uniref:6-bladed beta-propeller n=1 Tax=Parabacteroides sp. PFB2-10 TaxID=1742405 RepID=UPI002475BEC9|nr:6-bladed beta-propeller [Parabacteroides sp. PFB2-10]MDH6314128.1 hypothetical protein [Parabacteroides sp. PFB2-10]MDL2245170.1 6-bladed beta-propeller [Parabacteroides sp. OttesenSCG-928-J18]